LWRVGHGSFKSLCYQRVQVFKFPRWSCFQDINSYIPTCLKLDYMFYLLCKLFNNLVFVVPHFRHMFCILRFRLNFFTCMFNCEFGEFCHYTFWQTWFLLTFLKKCFLKT
jgi:hypothetical protein